MKILAFDTALGACSSAILDDGRIRSEISIEMARGHAEHLMAQIQEVLELAETSFQQLDRIAVTIGPGTFTGLRVGLAAARGMGLALSIPVVGVTSLRALAQHGANQEGVGQRTAGMVASFIDARNDETYGQLFAPDLSPICEPQRWSYGQAANAVYDQAVTDAPIFFVGSGSDPVLEAMDPSTSDRVATQPDRFPLASDVARIGSEVSVKDNQPPSPLYLRPPDAKPPKASQFLD